MFKYIFLVGILFFSGCVSSSENFDNNLKKEEDNFTTREYRNISKDAIFKAAKQIFILAGKKEFRIDSYRNRVDISKTKMSHYPFFAITSENRWILNIEEENNVSKVKLEIFKITDYEEDKPKFLNNAEHELLWNRIDYLLGLSDRWITCTEHYAYLNINDGLCDSIDLPRPTEQKNAKMIKDILISDREKSKSILEIEEDVLKDDISFSIEDSNTDILNKEDNIDTESNNNDETLDNSLDKEIQELDRKVNTNIDETLNKIEENIEDEPVLEQNK
ncbi:hypothetical protein [Arcobacter sp. LA11]|uniref:hypothetical protein n=1 Tax=Arcobacter sp. LA11 TaxID=1898176 RepID=UPI000933AE98|nr:hypothetical protein [Arcobacter sp. LA11]